jgi:hypothetical protein
MWIDERIVDKTTRSPHLWTFIYDIPKTKFCNIYWKWIISKVWLAMHKRGQRLGDKTLKLLYEKSN